MTRFTVLLLTAVLGTATFSAKAESLNDLTGVQADMHGPGGPGFGGPGFGRGGDHDGRGPGWGDHGGPGWGPRPGPGWGDHGGPGWGPRPGPGWGDHGGPGWGPRPGPGWGAPPPPPPSYGLPNGSYLQSCAQCNFDGRILSCYCRDTRGMDQGTSIDVGYCRNEIQNVNGQLYCQ